MHISGSKQLILSSYFITWDVSTIFTPPQCSSYGFLSRDDNESRHCHIRLKGFRQVNLINVPTTSEKSAGLRRQFLKAYRFKQKCLPNQTVFNTQLIQMQYEIPCFQLAVKLEYELKFSPFFSIALTDMTSMSKELADIKAQPPLSIYIKFQKVQEIFIPLAHIVQNCYKLSELSVTNFFT